MSLGIPSAIFARQDDSDLIPRLKQRDPEALGDLYDRYGPVAFALVLRMVKTESVAEEILASAFMIVWNRIHRYSDHGGRLGYWILGIARDRALQHLHKSEHGLPFSGHLAPENVPALFIHSGQPASGIEDVRHLRNAFVQLEEVFRIMLELLYFDGLSISEIAVRLDEPIPTIESWIQTALEGLTGAGGHV